MKFLKAIREKYIVRQYIKTGMLLGEMLSYVPSMGYAVGFGDTVRKLEKLETEIEKLGYEAIPLDEFEKAGGWTGKEPVLKKVGE